MTSFTYDRSGIDQAELVAEIDKAWGKLGASAIVRQKLLGAGLEDHQIKALLSRPRGEVLSVGESGQGLDPSTVTLLVALAPALAEMAPVFREVSLDIWREFILPALRKKYGSGTLPERK